MWIHGKIAYLSSGDIAGVTEKKWENFTFFVKCVRCGGEGKN